jgi:uncharacterized protein (TIGR03435 family)
VARATAMGSRGVLRNGVLALVGAPLGFLVAVSVLEAFPQAQAPQASARFEVASIRVNRDSSDRPTLLRPILQPGGRVLMRGQTVRDLIVTAYGVRQPQLIGGPTWAGSTSFDLEARGPSDSSASIARAMLRTLLADRFSLTVHSEQREVPVYVLTSSAPNGQPGSQLRPAAGQCTPPTPPDGLPPPPPSLPRGMMEAVSLMQGAAVRCQSIFLPGHISARAASLDALATELTNAIGRPVVNRTGLMGEFDIDLRYTPDLSTVADPQTSGPPAVATALQEQLGLRLEASRAPVEVLVIDRVAMPTEN